MLTGFLYVTYMNRTIWQMWRKTANAVKDQVGDIHTRLMKKNYEAVPQWWFHIILVSMVGLAIFACEGFGKQLQLPWWGVLMACGIALFFTLPIGIIQATTNQVRLCNHACLSFIIYSELLPSEL